MLLITCPHCGVRPEIEFRQSGESHIARPGPEASEAEMAEFLYLRTNAKGWVGERWRHVHGCGRFFNAVRHSVTDKFLVTYPAGAPRPDVDALLAEAGR